MLLQLDLQMVTVITLSCHMNGTGRVMYGIHSKAEYCTTAPPKGSPGLLPVFLVVFVVFIPLFMQSRTCMYSHVHAYVPVGTQLVWDQFPPFYYALLLPQIGRTT